MNSDQPIPIIVDLDDTLVRTDFFYESLLVFIKQNLFNIVLAFYWLIKKDRAYLKSQIAQRVSINVSILPYNQPLINWLKSKQEQGHKIVLATATHQKYADLVAQHVGIFDQVLATNKDHNLKGENKEKKLIELFGADKFIYVGDSEADLKVWRSSKAAVFTGSSAKLRQKLLNVCHLETEFPVIKHKYSDLKAIRIHQWVKNALIFVPLLTSHNLEDINRLSSTILAFLAFGFCASGVYIINDLFDLEDDRQHHSKFKRMFASGEVGIIRGVAMLCVCLVFALVLSLSISADFFIILLCYFLTTLAYSLWLKSKMMIDIIVLAGLYTIRIIAGAIAIEVELSFWLLAFSMFVFLSLALMKRHSELLAMRNSGKAEQAKARGYFVSDLNILAVLGATSGYISVLVMALYVNSLASGKLYSSPDILWGICPVLLFWMGRIWLSAGRGAVNDDPVLYVLKDKTSWITFIILIVIFFLAM